MGDVLVEIEGLPVAQADGDALKGRMHKAVGETLHLRLKRASGELYPAAAAKPQ